jgi:hypothetical protein
MLEEETEEGLNHDKPVAEEKSFHEEVADYYKNESEEVLDVNKDRVSDIPHTPVEQTFDETENENDTF